MQKATKGGEESEDNGAQPEGEKGLSIQKRPPLANSVCA